MKNNRLFKQIFAAILAVSGVLAFLLSQTLSGAPGDTSAAARRVERRLAYRMTVLENISDNHSGRIPDDMVIYRYLRDTLYSWDNQFPVMNDNISIKPIFPRIINPMMSYSSPLLDIPDSLSLCNLGDKWYLAKSVTDGESRTVMGLELMNTSDNSSFTGVNRHLRLSDRFVIRPLSYSEGSAVNVNGTPQFKICYESLSGNTTTSAGFVWIACALFLVAVLIFLESIRTIRCLILSVVAILMLMTAMYIWSLNADSGMRIFSPLLYAGGPLLSSLGSVIIINLTILLLVLSIYMVRKSIYGRIRGKGAVLAVSSAGILLVGLICLYSFFALKSILMNSNISLEIFKLEDFSVWSLIVYLSFLSMLMTVPFILQMLQPALSRLTGRHFNALSGTSRVAFSVIASLLLVTITSTMGYRKEKNRIEVWANRLAVERDIMLEMTLRDVEYGIASNMFISSLSVLDSGESTIRNIVADNYLARISQNYNVRVFVMNEDTPARRVEMLNSRLIGGEPIADNSHFLYCESPSGQPRYEGVFIYVNEVYGLSRVIVEIQPRTVNQEKGYTSLMGISAPGRFNLPPKYSFARYGNGNLVTYKGNYAYPTAFDSKSFTSTPEGYTHFVNTLSEDEAVVISRPTLSAFNYLIAAVFLTLLSYAIITLACLGSSVRRSREKSYFKTRISGVVVVALFLTLVVMALASTLYVYSRNEKTLYALMSDKISSIQSMLLNETENIRGRQWMMSPLMRTALETVSTNTNTDITIFSMDGRLVISTYREAMDLMVTGSRIDRNAYENIVRRGKRFFIQKEKLGNISFYNMYAPIMDRDNKVSGVMCSPYTGEETKMMERDTMWHIFTILTLFLTLLFFARFASNKVLDRMFKPLGEMGRKMNTAGLDSLEHLEYKMDDEITSLVDAYNRMVDDLSESTVKLAQAERDKAWSGMARQVAHEIKNPLTPMKLQLQRIIRLKQRGDEEWQDKFDEVAKLLLDHIDILTDTANEFSTFAKLYTEEPIEFDLDKVLKEEISMFDNYEGVSFEYMGFADARISGPKPQLTRVFVNILNNAVQALSSSSDGKIVVSLRNSADDGYYDIVFEDNGPGVADENISRLFSPNFTTKNGGSGLGLAISRSILERCGATIRYNRSFSLGGACFTVQYPR